MEAEARDRYHRLASVAVPAATDPMEFVKEEPAIALDALVRLRSQAEKERAADSEWWGRLALAFQTISNPRKDSSDARAVLTAINEAIAIRRRLADVESDTARHELVTSFVNMSATLAASGLSKDAFALAEEAVEKCRNFVALDPAVFQPDLAMSLGNLATITTNLGRGGEAQVALLEAVKVRRDLVAADPKRFGADLAASLLDLAKIASSMSRHHEAISATDEAIRCYRMLAEKDPGSFKSELAGALESLGQYLVAGRRSASAMDALKEATALYRELAVKNPGVYRTRFAEVSTSLRELYTSGITGRIRRSGSLGRYADVDFVDLATGVLQIGGENAMGGRAHLRLARTRPRLGPGARDPARRNLRFLSAWNRSIGVVGREPELADLAKWRERRDPISVRAMVGSAGTGKTRLALEACDRAVVDGWNAGFVDLDELAGHLTTGLIRTWTWDKPTLAVLDYAGKGAEIVKEWLRSLVAGYEETRPRLRVLLLERTARSDAGWFIDLFAGSDLGDLLDPRDPVPLLPLTGAAEKREVFRRTLEGLEAEAPLPDDADFEVRLDRLTWGGQPLFLMMAAVLAAESGMAGLLDLGPTDLAFELARREERRLYNLAKARRRVHPELVTYLAAYSTLCGGLDRKGTGLGELIDAEKREIGLPNGGDAGDVIPFLVEALGGDDRTISAVEPDLIGEALVLRRFRQLPGDAEDAVLRAFAWAPRSVAATVVRAIQDFFGDATHGGLALAWLDRLIAAKAEVAVGDLMVLSDAMPEYTVVMRERAVAISQAILALLPAEPGSTDDDARSVRAITLNNLGIRLSEVGRHEEALAAVEEASGLDRELAGRNPEAFRPNLASSLNNLGNRLSAVGRREQALAAVEEAAGLYRELAGRNPEAFRPNLASSLNNLGDRLKELGRAVESVSPYREAVAVLGPVFLALPSAFAGQMAMCARDYVEACTATGTPLDHALLGPIAEAFQRLQASNPGNPEAE
jgi:tetratricopeptide (TPR) repeat protein